jgi:hypothetical protein
MSIVWGVTLAILTLLEWNSLDRDPMRKQILSPFIERDIAVQVDGEAYTDPGGQGLSPPGSAGDDRGISYHVEFSFNGPLFMACFFTPVLVFHGVAWLLARLRDRYSQPR